MCNEGSFRPGHDPRRHVFTPEQRVRGGRVAWARTMIAVRSDMRLPIPQAVIDRASATREGRTKLVKQLRRVYRSTFDGLEES